MTRSVEKLLLDIDSALPSGSVLTDVDVLESYAHDESEAAPVMPDAVVRVHSASEVATVMRAATIHRVPVTPRAGGTGRSGGAIPLYGGIVLAFEQMTALKGIESTDLYAVVEPGLVTGKFHETVEAQGLFYPPDPNSLSSCALGGNVAENAGGPRAFKYGVTREYVLGMQVVTADGHILNLGRKTVKGVTGYDLTALMVGSEGTLALITEITFKLIAKPEALRTLMVLLKDENAIANAVNVLVRRGIVPRCIELLDSAALAVVRPHTSIPIVEGASAMLIVELDGGEAWVEQQANDAGALLLDAGALDVLVAHHSGDREKLWAARRELSYAMRRQAKFKLAEDVVVPRSRIGELLALSRQLAEKHKIRTATYGHAGDGNLHVNFLWDDEGLKTHVDAAVKELFIGVVALGGTLSGEHGVGITKAQYLSVEQSPELIDWQKRVKATFDPNHILNPGKIFSVDRAHPAC